MTRKLNIVYILTDQHRCDMLGCYGNKVVRTPNIDRLAAEGLRFSHAFTPTSICGPARASLLTGLFPSAHGVTGNSEHACRAGLPLDVAPEIVKLPEALPGYDYFHLGKWHAEETRMPSDYGAKGHDFDGYGFPGSDVYRDFVFDEGPTRKNRYAEWLCEKGFEAPRVSEAFFGNNPNLKIQELRAKLSGPAEASIPHFIVDDAIRLLREDRSSDESPFFMWMNFWGPHTPCVVPEPYYSMYPPKSIPIDPSFEGGLTDRPIHFKHISQMWGVHDLDWHGWQEIIARYYGYITMIDNCIGQFMQYLKEAGLYDNTVIVFTADHGDAMGAHQLIEKGEFMYDETYRIPMVVRHPALAKPGTTCTEFVYLHDLYPTAAEIATGTTPDMHGQSQSLLPLLTTPNASTGRDYVYGEFAGHFSSFPQRMLRSKEFKLIFNAAAQGELYDLRHDPHELHNLIDSADHAAVKAELLAKLQQQMQDFGDPLSGWLGRIIDVY